MDGSNIGVKKEMVCFEFFTCNWRQLY